MIELFKNIFSSIGSISVNGKSYENVKETKITSDGKTTTVIVNGKDVQIIEGINISVTLDGDCETVSTTNGNVSVTGSTEDVSTTNGSVTIIGNVNKVKTVNGSVKANTVINVRTVNGSVKGVK